MFDPNKNFVKNVLDTRKSLSESGGKLILGHNPLQVSKSSQLMKILNQWRKHIRVIQGNKHHKIQTLDGSIITTVKAGPKIGPRTAIDVLSTLRNHLIKIKAYTPTEGETPFGSQKRQNTVVIDKPQSSIPVRSREENQERLRGLLATTVRRFGDKRRSRVQRAIQKTRKALKGQ